MPRSPYPGHKSSQEEAFGLAFPELADMSTSEIRLLRASARALLHAKAKDMRRKKAMAEWVADNLAPLPFD